MHKKIILRLCHKFLINEDGYDLDIQDLCKSTSKNFKNYVLTYINGPIKDYIKNNNLSKMNDNFYYHRKLKTYICPIEYSKKHNTILNDLYLINNIQNFIEKYKKIFNYVKPNILSIHGTLIPQFLYSAYYSRNKCKVIATHHIGLINTHYQKQKGIILILKYIIHNLIPFFCNKVICVSNHGKKSFDFIKKNIEIINPIPLIPEKSPTNFNKIIKKNILGNKFKINKKDKIFCCIGRISKQKNQLNTIKAFNRVINKNHRYKLIIVGAASNKFYYKQVKKEIRYHPENYCLIKELDNSKVIKIIENSDFLISITFNEGFGRNGMEAQLLGKSIIASKNSGYEDYIEEGKNGILINPNNLQKIEKAIVNICKMRSNSKKSHKEYIKKITRIYNGK